MKTVCIKLGRERDNGILSENETVHDCAYVVWFVIVTGHEGQAAAR
jgi:hypothetical protein